MANRKRPRIRWKWVLAGLGLAVVAFLAAAWLLFQHVPSWYQPVEVAPDQVSQVQADLMRTTDALNERMVRADQPFEFQISQDQVNAWLAAREEMWPLSREWLPKGLTDPFVTMDPQGLRVAATVQWGSLQTVVSARLAVTADEQQVRVQLVDVRSGSLPVPRNWVQSELVRFQREHGHQLRWPPSSSRASDDSNNIVLSDLTDGMVIPNRGVWRQLDIPPRPFRVIGLRLEAGLLRVTVRPLNERVGQAAASTPQPNRLQR